MNKSNVSTDSSKLLIIGEEIHVLNPTILQAIENRDGDTLARLAGKQVEAGAHALDVNLGPGKATGKMTPWVIETIQQAVNVPLFLSAHVLSLQQGFKVHQGRATINAVTADPEVLPRAMATAKKFDANLVVLLVKPGMTAAGLEEKLQIATEVLTEALKTGLALERLYLDPLISIRPDPVTWAISRGMPDIDLITRLIELIHELGGGAIKTIVGLSNGSLGLSTEKRSVLHCRMLHLLAQAGLSAAIINCRDRALIEVAKAINEGQPLPCFSGVNRKAA